MSHTMSELHRAASSLNDAGDRIGNAFGPTDYRARLGSEGEVSALSFGTYCFAEVVYEITLHPRPASRCHTGDVETDHPRAGHCHTLWSYESAEAVFEYNAATDGIFRSALWESPRRRILSLRRSYVLTWRDRLRACPVAHATPGACHNRAYPWRLPAPPWLCRW